MVWYREIQGPGSTEGKNLPIHPFKPNKHILLVLSQIFYHLHTFGNRLFLFFPL